MFGKKKAVAKSVYEYQKHDEANIPYDRETNSNYNERKANKKGIRFRNKSDKKNAPQSIESETIWREVNLFWPETIAMVGAAIAGIILMFVIRFMSATGLELIREMLTEQAYFEVAGLLQNINTIFIGVAAIPFLVLIGFWFYRFLVFTPRKDKHMVARIKRTGAIKLTVEKIKDHEMDFERGIATKMSINNPRKHWLENIGKPFIFLFEGDDCNADLNAMAGNVSSKSREVNTVNENAISYGRRIEKYIQEQKDNLFANPMFYIMVVMLIAIVLVGFLVLQQPEQIQAMLAGA